jgi:FixJ family two-component response regulator
MTDPESIVFVVDDDAQVRSSLANLCRSVDLNVQAFASTEEFLNAERPMVPSCIILDVRFPGSAPSGLDFQRRLVDAHDSPPIIFVTGHGDIRMSVQAMKRGAVEFLTKPVREQELLDAIRRGIEQDRRRLEEAKRLASLRQRFESLTAREREIMSLVTQGLLNKQIAAALGLSEVTVKAHRGHIMQKMEAKSFADLVRMSDQLSSTAPPVNGTDDTTT